MSEKKPNDSDNNETQVEDEEEKKCNNDKEEEHGRNIDKVHGEMGKCFMKVLKRKSMEADKKRKVCEDERSKQQLVKKRRVVAKLERTVMRSIVKKMKQVPDTQLKQGTSSLLLIRTLLNKANVSSLMGQHQMLSSNARHAHDTDTHLSEHVWTVSLEALELANSFKSVIENTPSEALSRLPVPNEFHGLARLHDSLIQELAADGVDWGGDDDNALYLLFSKEDRRKAGGTSVHLSFEL